MSTNNKNQNNKHWTDYFAKISHFENLSHKQCNLLNQINFKGLDTLQ